MSQNASGTVVQQVGTLNEAARGGIRASWSAQVVPMSLLFGATIFAGSGLVFFVEPMFAKMALPLLGGSPSVWNTCVVFFQAALLCGYAYAHALSSRFTIRAQVAVHAILLALAALTLPIAIPAGWAPPTEAPPVPWLLALLTVSVGAPFVVASATAPLLQRWFSATAQRSAADPYFLYSASNLGSLAALLAYPVLVEPAWPLSTQTGLWAAGFGAFGVLTLACGATVVFARRASTASALVAPDADADTASVADHDVSWARRARWLALSAVPSGLMLSVTTYISTDIAAAPLLWIVPLVIYLLSFVVAFARTPLVPASLARRATPLLVAGLVLPMMRSANGAISFFLTMHLLTFAAAATALHTELANDRPGARRLTEFYLWLAIGGVVGGAFNVFVAPVVFTTIAEYPLELVAACLLLPWREGLSRSLVAADLWRPAALGVAAFLIGLAVHALQLDARSGMILSAPLAVWCFSFSRRPTRFALGVAMLLLAGYASPGDDGVLFAERSFFGVHRVAADNDGQYHVLSHGTTIHGQQSLAPGRRHEPLTYYHQSGPVGQALQAVFDRHPLTHVGVVGLGAGSLAAYARPGQHWTFYELDPTIERIARDPRFFTYLTDCGPACRVVLGDARLSLAQAGEGAYDTLVLDAFSSDAIPIHLLTRDAVALYLTKLSPDGVLAVHISNRHLDLGPVLGAIAHDLGLVMLTRVDRVSDVNSGHLSSEWVVIARDDAAVDQLARDPRWTRAAANRSRAWTDEYSNIIGALKGF